MPKFVMAGQERILRPMVPAIHGFSYFHEDVDTRHFEREDALSAGHDGGWSLHS